MLERSTLAGPAWERPHGQAHIQLRREALHHDDPDDANGEEAAKARDGVVHPRGDAFELIIDGGEDRRRKGRDGDPHPQAEEHASQEKNVVK